MMNSEKSNNIPTFLRVKLVLIGLNIQMFSEKKNVSEFSGEKKITLNKHLFTKIKKFQRE